ncbi:MAG: hypothetical protein CFE43_11435 [Burkholderiales bacterium PBB3]|nr:MAG: hypothetical protein CFE43_11435 [Burkholderiales bacterium PBB3]
MVTPPVRNSRRLLLIVWIFVGIVVGLLVFAYYSIGLMSAARAYVGGEGLWSKAQKDAVLSLSRYVADQKPLDYQAFQEALKVNLGDRQARLELEKTDPDFNLAYNGFLQGRNHPNDIDGMMRLYRSFRTVPDLSKVIAVWKAADAQIDAMIALGEKIHDTVQGPGLNDSDRRNFQAQLAQINAQVTPLEDEFSFTLGDISRRSKSILRFIMILMATVLVVVAYGVSRRILQQNEHDHQVLLESENQLRSTLQLAPLPIILVSLPGNQISYANERALAQFNTKAEDLGALNAQDFYVKPEDRDRVMEALQQHGSVRDWEVQLKDQQGLVFWALLSCQRLALGGRECILTAINNIDERKRVQEELRHRAFHDELTGLPNRAMFMDSLSRTLHRAERKQGSFSILFIDLDRFKSVNDNYGHTVGDLLLQAVAMRVRMCVREGDLVARLGGDEFVVLVEADHQQDEVAHIAKKLQTVLEPIHTLGEHRLQVTASIGISSYPQDGTELDVLLRNADSAMYRVKEDGRNNFQFHSG